MKWLLNILVSFALYLLLCSQGCDHRDEAGQADQARVEKTQDSLRAAFQSGNLSEESLKAFETMAEQKVADLGDYFGILRDSSIAETFKEKTREMILGLFINDSSLLHLEGPGRSAEPVSVNSLIRPGSGYSSLPGNIPYDSVRVIHTLHQINDTLCSGQLCFPFRVPGKKEGKQAGKPVSSCTVDFIVLRCSKKFGKDTLKVWSVFLGN
jgi:hypothetical protein